VLLLPPPPPVRAESTFDGKLTDAPQYTGAHAARSDPGQGRGAAGRTDWTEAERGDGLGGLLNCGAADMRGRLVEPGNGPSELPVARDGSPSAAERSGMPRDQRL
jgi:hypothetical protein